MLSTRRGEVQAFGELVRRYQTLVFSVCYRLLAERREAEDLAQETFIRAYERLGSFDAERPFGPWICRVATNLCINQLQRKELDWGRIDEERHTAPPSAEFNPELAQARSEQAETIRAALLSLPPQYRAVIELRHFQDLSYAEISEVLEISVSQVKSHLFRARKSLAKEIKTYDAA